MLVLSGRVLKCHTVIENLSTSVIYVLIGRKYLFLYYFSSPRSSLMNMNVICNDGIFFLMNKNKYQCAVHFLWAGTILFSKDPETTNLIANIT